VNCPACASPAEVTRRYVLDSTDGPIEHAIVMCASGHIWNGPIALLAEEPA
jgi:hypothetical protein